jgi:hypothetical protein
MGIDADRFKRNNKKIGNDTWAQWLADEPPAAGAEAELRQRRVQQANSYQPRPVAPPLTPPTAAVPPQSSTPISAPNTTPAATVSIQIHMPSFRGSRVARAVQAAWQSLRRLSNWYTSQFALNRARTVGFSALLTLAVVGAFILPLLHLIHGGADHATGSSAGALSPKYSKPPFTVVVPSSKPKLATPDGVHAAYDGTKNVYTYSDSIGGNGFIVSEQPIPEQFNAAADAINSIGPKIYGPTAANSTVNTFAGDAYVTLSNKGAQTIVFSVRNLLMFIQSAHKFSDTAIQDYINSMQ